MAATFVMALFSFGLGFYGLTVYVASLQRLYGWSASTVSLPVTVYYIAGALLTVLISDVYGRYGPRVVVAAGGDRHGHGGGDARDRHATVATLSRLRRDVAGLGSDERRRDQHRARPLVGASARSRSQPGVQRGDARGCRHRARPRLAHRCSWLHASAGRRRARAGRRDACHRRRNPAIRSGRARHRARRRHADGREPTAPRRASWTRRCTPHVALLERVSALRPRPDGSGRRAHAPGPARDAGAWRRRVPEARSARRRPRR